jgi:hypothetical protein
MNRNVPVVYDNIKTCAGISYPHSRACPLIGSFCWGLLIVTTENGKAIEISYSLVPFFVGFHIMTTGNVFLCLTMIQKRKNIKTLDNLINTRGATTPRTNQIPSCFDALSIT